jgi:hypothetical protein
LIFGIAAQLQELVELLNMEDKSDGLRLVGQGVVVSVKVELIL